VKTAEGKAFHWQDACATSFSSQIETL